MAYIKTDCYYPFSRGGKALRNVLVEQDVDRLGPCVIPPPQMVGGKPWLGRVRDPSDLQCAWVKVAGNIVILPLGSDSSLAWYSRWQAVSEQTHFGLAAR